MDGYTQAGLKKIGPEQTQPVAPSMQSPDAIDPALLAQLMSLGVMDDKGDILTNQVAQAQALQRPQQNQYGHTPWGAALGGLGEAIDKTRGAYRESQLRGKQQGLLDQKTDARDTAAQLLQARALRAQGFDPAAYARRQTMVGNGTWRDPTEGQAGEFADPGQS